MTWMSHILLTDSFKTFRSKVALLCFYPFRKKKKTRLWYQFELKTIENNVHVVEGEI